MLLDFKNTLRKYELLPTGVIHVGMHLAEEYDLYVEEGIENIIFIEANQKLIDEVLEKKLNAKIIHAAISDGAYDIEFKVTNNNQSSSILDLGDHALIYPHITVVDRIKMTTKTLDDVLSESVENPEKYNLLNFDIQGVELQAMKGFSHWEHIDAVFTEVNFREMYQGCDAMEKITEFLQTKGLTLGEFVDTGCGWGDAFYYRPQFK
jgi:FkbM family methyltransferase